MILVSVIVPVYNTEKYLRQCIMSLLNQTLESMEIIAIDDGSKDRSGDILDEFQVKFPDKIKVYHQKNEGISAVRNKGLILAKGKYIAFVDSDDSVDPKYCELLASEITSKKLDMVVCDFFEVQREKMKRICMPHINDSTVYDTPELLFDINTSPWNKMYDVDFLTHNNIEFPLGLKYEDTVFVHKIMANGAKIGFINLPLVYYRIHDKSETTVINQNVFDIFEILDIVCNAYRNTSDENYQRICGYLEYFVINRITVYNLQQIYQKTPGMENKFVTEGFKYLDHEFPYWRKNRYFNNNNNLFKRILKKHMWVTKGFVNITKIFGR